MRRNACQKTQIFFVIAVLSLSVFLCACDDAETEAPQQVENTASLHHAAEEQDWRDVYCGRRFLLATAYMCTLPLPTGFSLHGFFGA